MKPLLKVIWVTFPSLTKLHYISFLPKNSSRFLITSAVQCGLQSVRHCPSVLRKQTTVLLLTLSSVHLKMVLYQKKFHVWHRNVTIFKKLRPSFKGKELDTVLLYKRWLRAPQSCKRKHRWTTVKTFNRELPLFSYISVWKISLYLRFSMPMTHILEGPSPWLTKQREQSD